MIKFNAQDVSVGLPRIGDKIGVTAPIDLPTDVEAIKVTKIEPNNDFLDIGFSSHFEISNFECSDNSISFNTHHAIMLNIIC